jgi:hypothetical protein
MIEELKAKAAEHWSEWLPAKWAALVEENRVDQELTRVATLAEREIREWMNRGARLDEAEEIVLPRLILLPPENKDSTGSLEQDQELIQMEAEYQERMRRETAAMRTLQIQQDVDEGVPREMAELRAAIDAGDEIPWSNIRGGEKGWYDRQLAKELAELRKYRK